MCLVFSVKLTNLVFDFPTALDCALILRLRRTSLRLCVSARDMFLIDFPHMIPIFQVIQYYLVSSRRRPGSSKFLDAGYVIPDTIRDRHDVNWN